MNLKNLSRVADSADLAIEDYPKDFIIKNTEENLKKYGVFVKKIEVSDVLNFDGPITSLDEAEVAEIKRSIEKYNPREVYMVRGINGTTYVFDTDQYVYLYKDPNDGEVVVMYPVDEESTDFKSFPLMDSVNQTTILGAIDDASYEDIGRNFARKFFKENGEEGFTEAIAKWRYRNKQESVDAANDEMAKLINKAALKQNRRKSEDEENKEELYKLTQQFVRKYWKQYYPQYKGEIDDLISDFYTEFLTPKSREEGKEQTLLDKFDPEKTSLAYLTKVAVQRKLIDRARTDKGEKNYNERYDEETGDLSLDYITNHIDEPDISIDEVEFDDDEIAEIKKRYKAMSEADRKKFLDYYSEVKGVLAPNFKALFKEVVGDSISDSSEEYCLISLTPGLEEVDTEVRYDGKNGYVIDKGDLKWVESLKESFGQIGSENYPNMKVVKSDELEWVKEISDAESVTLTNKPYSMYELQNKPPKWVEDYELWDHIVETVTHNGEKEVKIVVPLAIYKRKIAAKKKALESEDAA